MKLVTHNFAASFSFVLLFFSVNSAQIACKESALISDSMPITIITEVMRVWPGDTVDNVKEGSEGQDGDQEPGKDYAHHSQAEQHQGQVLQQHFSLHGETHIHCREKT